MKLNSCGGIAPYMNKKKKKLIIKVRKTDVERRKSMSGRKDKAGVKGES